MARDIYRVVGVALRIDQLRRLRQLARQRGLRQARSLLVREGIEMLLRHYGDAAALESGAAGSEAMEAK